VEEKNNFFFSCFHLEDLRSKGKKKNSGGKRKGGGVQKGLGAATFKENRLDKEKEPWGVSVVNSVVYTGFKKEKRRKEDGIRGEKENKLVRIRI